MMRAVLFATVAIAVVGTAAEKWNLEAREKFAAQRFGIFIH